MPKILTKLILTILSSVLITFMEEQMYKKKPLCHCSGKLNLAMQVKVLYVKRAVRSVPGSGHWRPEHERLWFMEGNSAELKAERSLAKALWKVRMQI